MDWNARTDQNVASVRQQYLPQGSTSCAYVQSQQAPLPPQNVSNYPSRIQEDCLYPKLNTVAPLIPNNCYGTSNQLPPLTRSSDMPTQRISNTVCSENTYPQNSQTAGLMKEPLVYQQIITKVSPLPASNSSQIALQSQPSSGNLQMHQVTSNQFRVQTSSNGGQHTNLPVMVSCTSLPNQQGTTSSNKMCLVWVPHQNYNQPLTRQFQKQSTPLRPINTHLQSQLRAGIPNASCQNNPVLLQPKQQYRSAPTTHMLQNSPVSQQCAAVLPQPVNMQLHAHQTMAFHNSENRVTFANPTVTVSQGQSQKSIILPQLQQLYKGTKANVNLQNLYPPDFFSNSTSQPVQCQPPPRTQPVNVKNCLVLDEPKLLETISPNLNVSITDSDLNKAQMAPFNHRYVSGSTALKEVGILQNMCKNGQETQTSGFPLGEKFTVTLNTLQPPGSTPDCSVELSNCANGSDQPVNFTTSVKKTPVLTEDDMIREVQNLLRAKEDFLNLVKDFKEKRKIYRSLKSNKDSPSNVKCTRTANKLNCMLETQVEPKVPDKVANLTSLPLQPSNVLAEQQKIDQHKRVEEKTNVCTDSTDSSQRNNQYKLASQKVAKDPEILTYMPDEKQNYLFNKASSSQLKEITRNQNSSKLSEATTTVQTLSQEHIVVSPSIKKDRSPVLAELITEVINSYSKLTETQSCFPKSSEKPNDAVHTNKNDQFSNMVCSISHASTSDVSTLRDANLKEGTVMHSLTEDESYQLGNNLTEVLKSCAGMWTVPTSVRKMESKQLPSTNEDLEQTLSTPEICDQNSFHLKNFQQTLAASKTVTSINVNDTYRTVAGSSSTMVKAFEPQVAIVNPLRLFKSKSTIVHPENKCATIEGCPVGQEGSISRVLGGVSSGAQNNPRSNLHPMFGATALDASLLSANDQSEMVTLGGSSSIGNINPSESVQSLQTEKIMQCPDVPNHPKSPDVLSYEHEIQELFKSQPSHTCEEDSVPQRELNKNGSSVICIEDAVDEQLKISSFCTLVEGNTLYDSQIAQMFDGGISTSCKTSQRESVGLITPALLESNDPNTTQVSNTAQQGLTDQPFFNLFSEGANEHHSLGSDKVFLKISEHNSDSAQTTPDSCNKERQPDEKNELVKHPCVTSETEDGHFRNKEQKEYVPFTHIQMCTPNSERQPDSDQHIHVQNDCVLPEYYLEDDTLNILSAQCLNDQLSEVPFTHRLVSKPNLEIQTPSDQDIYIEKDDCVIPVNTFNILSVQCLSDQLSELQQEFPYGFERLGSILSLKTSLVNQKALNERGNVVDKECLRNSCNSSSPDIYCPMTADSTNFVTEHYSESKPMMSKNCNEYSNSNEPDNLNDDGCDPSQLKDLQLNDCNISTIDVCDSDNDDFVKQIKITVLDSEQMNKFFPEMTSQCVTNDNIQCSQWNMQSDKNIENKVSLTNLNSDNPSVILQTDVEENCSSSNEKQFCCLYRWLSSDYGSAPKCSCLPDEKTDDAASNLECKDTDAKVVDNTSSGNGGIIYLSTESSDEDDNLTIDYQDQKRQNRFATSTDIKQIKADVKTSPMKTKNGFAEQKLQPLHIAQSEMKPLSLQDKGCLAQPAANNISSKTDIELNLKDDTCKTDHCKESLHSTDSVVEGTGNNVIKDFQVEERGKKLDNLSMSPKSKNERLIVKTDFLKSTKRADVRQEVIDGKACDLSDTSDEELQKKKSKQNGEQFKNRIFESTKTSKKNMGHKEPDLGFNSNEEHNTKPRRNYFPPSTPLHITAAKITVAHEWGRTFNLSDPSEEENEEVEYILADCSQEPSEEQPGSEANTSIIPRRKLTNVVKVPSKKRFPGKRMCRETVEPPCATSTISDVKYPSKYHTKNVLTKNVSTIWERFQHVRACPKSERTKKIKACPSVKNVNIPNLDKSKNNAVCFGENLSSDNMEKVLPACRGIPLNSMTSKSYPPYKSQQNVDSLSSKQFKSNQLHVRRGSDSNMSIANENVNAQGQGAEGSKVHYLNRVAFTSTSSERIHLRKLEFGISPSKLGGGRQSSKSFEATDLKKPLRVAVSQNAAEKSQMLEFKLCPEVLLSCSSVDESTNDNTLFDPEKSSVEGIRSRKEDWLKNIPLKKRKVDMTKFQAENPLLDSPIFVPNTSPVEVAKQPAPGSKATFHAYKRLYLEKRSKSLNITPGK